MAKQERLGDKPTPEEYLRAIICAPIYEVAKKTELQEMPKLSERLGNTILVKREDNQPVHSFKIRGAYAMMSQLSDEEKARGIITASAGNHAQGVALAGKNLGLKPIIVMPKVTPDIKIDAVKNFGGKVVLHGANFDEAKAYAIEKAQKDQMTFVPPFDSPAVIAGQGTIGLELIQQYAHLDMIFVPVGGGGLAAGVSVLIKQLMPHIKVIGVEPKDAACLKAAFDANQPTTLERVSLFAEGVAVKRIGDETFRLCKEFLDDVTLVDSDEICAALKDIFDDVRAVGEPSGALALAGLKKYVQQNNITKKNLVHVLSGANMNFHTLRYVSERAEIGEQREALFVVTIPEEKGSFLRFCKILGNRSVTEFSYRYSKLAKDQKNDAKIFVGIRLMNGLTEKNEILNLFTKNNLNATDLSNNDMTKTHLRYMMGGRVNQKIKEKIFSFEFPEASGALVLFLETLGSSCNITLFHYRSHGADYGRVLCGFENKDEDIDMYLSKIGYSYREETQNIALEFFVK
ncbi:threonine ammonia-lyase, biosynthetic [Thorsellia kenyensis]|uniref:L-threonine dehydratase n=1 Tax=Thorsellia kenyensis TaxID=1549888 RepID=A0ABV6C9I0_9GAMM